MGHRWNQLLFDRSVMGVNVEGHNLRKAFGYGIPTPNGGLLAHS
jgi:hypothetical protein